MLRENSCLSDSKTAVLLQYVPVNKQETRTNGDTDLVSGDEGDDTIVGAGGLLLRRDPDENGKCTKLTEVLSRVKFAR